MERYYGKTSTSGHAGLKATQFLCPIIGRKALKIGKNEEQWYSANVPYMKNIIYYNYNKDVK